MNKENQWPKNIDLSKSLKKNDYKIYGMHEYDGIGNHITTGDFNGDGKSDLMIGSINSLNEAGQTYFIFGKETPKIQPPILIHPFPNQILEINQPFEIIIPKDTFMDLNNESLIYSLTQSNGFDLPAWANFDQNILSGFANTVGINQWGLIATNEDQVWSGVNFTVSVLDNGSKGSEGGSYSGGWGWEYIAGGIGAVIMGIGISIGIGYKCYKKYVSERKQGNESEEANFMEDYSLN